MKKLIRFITIIYGQLIPPKDKTHGSFWGHLADVGFQFFFESFSRGIEWSLKLKYFKISENINNIYNDSMSFCFTLNILFEITQQIITFSFSITKSNRGLLIVLALRIIVQQPHILSRTATKKRQIITRQTPCLNWAKCL